MKSFLSKVSVAFISSLLLVTSAQAAKGVVVYKDMSCDYFIVNTPKGFSLLEHFSGRESQEGNIVVGDYESYGMKTIYNLSSDSESRVYVEDYWLSERSVINKYIDKCS